MTCQGLCPWILLGRLNSPSPLSLRDISPHCGESPQTHISLPLASSLSLYKRLSLLSAGSNCRGALQQSCI